MTTAIATLPNEVSQENIVMDVKEKTKTYYESICRKTSRYS